MTKKKIDYSDPATWPLWVAKTVQNWPSAIVARNKVEAFSGGVLTARTVANMDCRGEGPKGKLTLGYRSVAYPVESVAALLAEMAAQPVKAKAPKRKEM